MLLCMCLICVLLGLYTSYVVLGCLLLVTLVYVSIHVLRFGGTGFVLICTPFMHCGVILPSVLIAASFVLHCASCTQYCYSLSITYSTSFSYCFVCCHAFGIMAHYCDLLSITYPASFSHCFVCCYAFGIMAHHLLHAPLRFLNLIFDVPRLSCWLVGALSRYYCYIQGFVTCCSLALVNVSVSSMLVYVS